MGLGQRRLPSSEKVTSLSISARVCMVPRGVQACFWASCETLWLCGLLVGEGMQHVGILGRGFKELCRSLVQCRCAEAQERMRMVCADICAIDYITVDEQGLW
jgi:hypothetical protein